MRNLIEKAMSKGNGDDLSEVRRWCVVAEEGSDLFRQLEAAVGAGVFRRSLHRTEDKFLSYWLTEKGKQIYSSWQHQQDTSEQISQSGKNS
jgi:hypothetical protein